MPRIIKNEKNASIGDNNLIGRRIEAARSRKGLTQAQLGKLVGVSAQQIQKYESGKDNVSHKRIQELSHALDVRASFFFEDTAPRNFSYSMAEADAGDYRFSDDNLPQDLKHGMDEYSLKIYTRFNELTTLAFKEAAIAAVDCLVKAERASNQPAGKITTENKKLEPIR